MIKRIYKCDICGKEAEGLSSGGITPEGWAQVEIKIRPYDTSKYLADICGYGCWVKAGKSLFREV